MLGHNEAGTGVVCSHYMVFVCVREILFLTLVCFFFFTGAYLVPYLILLIVIGIPLFFLELSVGQRIRRGSIGVWNYISPRLGGIGFASCVVSQRHCHYHYHCGHHTLEKGRKHRHTHEKDCFACTHTQRQTKDNN